MWLEEEEEKHTPRPQIRSHGRKLFILDIATVNPLLFYETGSKCTGGYYGYKLLWVFNDKRLIIEIKKVGKCFHVSTVW